MYRAPRDATAARGAKGDLRSCQHCSFRLRVGEELVAAVTKKRGG